MAQLLPAWARRWISGTEERLDRGEYELVGATHSSSGQVLEKDREPTDAERKTLRKVADHLPWYASSRLFAWKAIDLTTCRSTFLIAVVELCERFTYYGLSGPFQNYISNSYHDPNGLPGVRTTKAILCPPSLHLD